MIVALPALEVLFISKVFGMEMIVAEIDGIERNFLRVLSHMAWKNTFQINPGDTICIKNADDTIYLYKVVAIASDGIISETLVLCDAYNSQGEYMECSVHSACVTFLAVPYLGYMVEAFDKKGDWLSIVFGIVLFEGIFSLTLNILQKNE